MLGLAVVLVAVAGVYFLAENKINTFFRKTSVQQ